MNSVAKVDPEETEEGDGERDLLLASKPKPKPALVNGGGGGSLAKKRQQQRGSRRRVQWNDRNGNKLVEVLEFQPRKETSNVGIGRYRVSVGIGSGHAKLYRYRPYRIGIGRYFKLWRTPPTTAIDTSDSEDEYGDSCICTVM